MNLASQKLFLVVASAAIALAGCAKKPARPDPSITNPMGRGIGGTDVNTQPQTTITDFGGLPPRPAIDPNAENPEALRAQTIYFDYDQSAIKASERAKLKIAKEFLDKNPAARLVLEGRCDWHGTAEYNLALGDRRAGAVKKYLQSLGVPADRLETRSKGSLEASKTADDATRAKDRRVDLLVVNPGAMTSQPIGALSPL